MPWHVTYVESEKTVLITNSGDLTYEDFVSEAEEAVALMQQHQTSLCLVDDRDYNHPAKIADLYRIVDVYESFGVSKTERVALLFSPENPFMDDFKFFETVCRNRGFNFKIFFDEIEAKNWLKE